ncbi:hypothetical protein BH11ARM2_BH11ARM2_16060 [soil metagenome]
MKPILLTLLILLAAIPLVGCNDETQPDPAVVESMNKQRGAMQPGKPPEAPASAGK